MHRSSGLPSLAALASPPSPAPSSSPPPPHPPPATPYDSQSSSHSSYSLSRSRPTPGSSNQLDSSFLAPPNSGPSSPRPSTSSSHSSTRTNPGFVVTSRTRNYAPPASPQPSTVSLPAPGPAPTSSSNGSRTFSHPFAPSSTPYPPPTASGSGIAAGLLPPGFPPSLGTRRGSSPAAFPTPRRSSVVSDGGCSGVASPTTEPKTTLTLSSSIDAKGRRMVNQYVRLKTIGQGSHGKVWLCAEPTIRESDEDEGEGEEGEGHEEQQYGEGDGRDRRRRKRTASERWEDDIDQDRVRYCAIKSVARDGPGRNKSLRAAKGKKASSQGSAGIGADDKVKREVAIMKRLDHPNIVRLKEVIDDAKSKKVFMVLEFMAGGQVEWQDENKQPTMTVDEARRTFRDVVLGLEYLHYQGIIHRDIKPANLLWTADHSLVKISDFGVSHVSDALFRCSADNPGSCEGHDDDKALRKTAGSPAFFAPELCFPADYTPTPNAHSSSHLKADGAIAEDAYFPYGIDSSRLAPSASSDSHYLPGSCGAVYTPPTTPNSVPSSTLISLPLPPPSASEPRARPPVGRGIDVWALGVTLYCLLFGDTPFTARTEYELYNVIVREPVRVPLKMGVEGAWTGVPPGFEGCGDGKEGREVVDLLGKLLEKDPTKRIKLDEVKKHPWVMRKLASPEHWLHSSDPDQLRHVTVTDEDVQHATQERGDIDTLPPIRNRPGIRRALNAALSRFPAFSRIKSTRTTASTNSEDAAVETERERRSRTKSASSTTDGLDTTTGGSVSRQPSDGSRTKPSKHAHEFGLDLRRIISAASGGTAVEPGTPRSPSPADMGARGVRGGWGNRSGASSRKTTAETPTSPTSASPSIFPELARSVSSNSILGNGTTPGSRGGFSHHLFGRKVSADSPQDNASSSSRSNHNSLSNSSSPAFSAQASPSLASSEVDTPAGRQRTLSRMLSRLGGGGGSQNSGTSSPYRSSRSSGRNVESRQTSVSTDDGSQEVAEVTTLEVAPGVVEQFEARDHYDAFGRHKPTANAVPKQQGFDASDSKSLASGLTAAKEELDAAGARGGDDEDNLDLTEFEYSESDDDDDEDEDDDLDDFMSPALANANHLSGWQRPDFADFSLGIRSPSEDDGAGGMYSSGGSPPTEELDDQDEDGLIIQPTRKPSPPQPDNVSYAFVPLDYQFLDPASPPIFEHTESLYRSTPPTTDFDRDDHTPRSHAPVPHPLSLSQPAPSSSSPSTTHNPYPRAPSPLPSPTYASESYYPTNTTTSFLRAPPPPPGPVRDGSIRGVSVDPPRTKLGSAWQQNATGGRMGDGEEEESEEEEEMLVVPQRRRRAATLSNTAGSPVA